MEISAESCTASFLQKLTGPFSPKKEREWIDELIGQAADGFGEGFEQQGIKIEGGPFVCVLLEQQRRLLMENESDFQQRISGSPHFGEICRCRRGGWKQKKMKKGPIHRTLGKTNEGVRTI